jgi:hypothetical protein
MRDYAPVNFQTSGCTIHGWRRVENLSTHGRQLEHRLSIYRSLSRLPVSTLAGGLSGRAAAAGGDTGARISWRPRYALKASGNLARRPDRQAVMEATIASALRVASQSGSKRPRRGKPPVSGTFGRTRATGCSGRHTGPTIRHDHQRRRRGAA